MNKNKSSPIGLRIIGVAGALVLMSGSVFATAIGTGEANTGGTVLVSSAGIFFSNFTAPGPNTGSYAGTTSVTQGNLVGAATLTPNLSNWATFTGPAGGPIIFDLQTINPGVGNLAGCLSDTVGNRCTPSANSGITITQVSANQVSISLTGSGIAYTGSSATGSTPTVVSFTSQNNIPGTITSILLAVNTTGFTNSVSATYDSTGAATVPEPMTLSMMGFGLLGLGLLRRRKQS
jgi:PEP-CTERM motif-containing protein